MTDPLAGLPRPLSDRDAGRRRSRRSLSLGAGTGVLGATIFLLATQVGSSSFQPIGAVAGAEGTIDPAAVAGIPERHATIPPDAPAAEASPTPAPTRSAAPTPTPLPTPVPPERLTGYRWPLPRGRLTLPFGPSPWGSRIVDGEKFHDGIDLATFCGDRIVAAHAGTVLAAGRHYDAVMGWVGDLQPYLDRLDKKGLYPTLPIVVVIDDGNGYRSIYAHFSKITVSKGDVVKAGQLLGYEGMTGRASGCHLHYGLFSPLETATFKIDPTVVKRMKLPTHQLARIDPLPVLGERPKPKKTATPAPTMPP